MKLPEIDKKATGENIKRLMRKRHLQIVDIQNALRVSSATNIYAWCRGDMMPRVDQLVKLSAILGCTIDEIIVRGGGENV